MAVSIAVTAIFVSLLSRVRNNLTDRVTFRVINPDTGITITNAKALVCRRWTRFAVEKLGFKTLNAWSEHAINGPDGRIIVPDVPRDKPLEFFIMFSAPHFR
jgi:hypothetical protein